MECRLCGSTRFRLSRLRFPDLSELIFLRYPVRCRVCYKREFVNLFTALKIQRAHKLRREETHRHGPQRTSTSRRA